MQVNVKHLEVDITGYEGPIDFQVYSEYLNSNEFYVVVRRLDANAGWTEHISVLATDGDSNSMTIPIGPSNDVEKRVLVRPSFPIQPDTTPIQLLESYADLSAYEVPNPQRLSRTTFNRVFQTDIKALPHNLFAVGIRNGEVYMYNETYQFLFMIELTLRHIIRVVLHSKLFKEAYFIVCAYDGYLEHHYLSRRTRPRLVSDIEFKDANYVTVDDDDVYPVFHSDQWILAQSTQRGVPFCADMPDRYYFCLYHYNMYRSIHTGLPFDSKMPKIVYASQPRGSKYNFTSRRDIQVSQREYFYSDAVPKANIVAPSWIDRAEQIKYKYILDIDGNSSTWDATAWKLNSGSVLFKTDGAWRQWFYDEFRPWIHYVPIKDDFSDIDDKFTWCETHQDECRAMIRACKALFQKVYHYPNVVKYTISKLFEVSGLPQPTTLTDGRRLFIFRDPAHRMSALWNASRKLNPNDLLLFVNGELCDFNAFESNDFVLRYDALGKKIIAGAERNLWPEALAPCRGQFDAACDSNNIFKYIQVDMIIGTAGALYRLFDERIYDPTIENIIDQEYFARAWIMGKYDIGLDYDQTLALLAFQCDSETVEQHRRNGVPLIVWNGGRPARA